MMSQGYFKRDLRSIQVYYLEKAASGASDACGHFDRNHAILSQMSCNFEWGWRKKSWQWRNEVWWRWFEVEGWRIEDLGYKIKIERQCIEDRQSRFEDSIISHQNSIHMFLFVLWREWRYLEDIVKFWIFRLRTIYNFFQVWTAPRIWKFSPKSFCFSVVLPLQSLCQWYLKRGLS